MTLLTEEEIGRIEGKEPNWFWRKMQYLILGNRWEKKL